MEPNLFNKKTYFILQFFVIASLILQTGCLAGSAKAANENPSINSVSQDNNNVIQTSAASTAVALLLTQQPTDIVSGIDSTTIWISNALPSKYYSETDIFSKTSQAQSEETASVKIIPLAYDQPLTAVSFPSTWIYAFVAPFPTSVDNVSLDDILLAWQGFPAAIFQDKQILMSASTRQAFEMLWGRKASDEGVRVVNEQEILDIAWSEQPAWAIIPFEQVSPRWKVIQVDGLSPLDKDLQISKYPLKITFGFNGDVKTINSIQTAIENGEVTIPSTNRDESKLADVILTGVTALVRYTALRMEEQGLTYPAEGIGDWLKNADLAHVSNEVPFDTNCPPAVPLRREARFCSDPKYIELLKYTGIDLVELTGNHLLDWDVDPFLYTLNYYNENQIAYYGGGYNQADAREAHLVELNGNKIAFIGCNAIGPESTWASEDTPGTARCDLDWMESEIKRLSADGYLVIVTFQHFEVCEFKPQSTQKIDFQRMASAGAVIVSGSQAHCPQGMTFIDGNFIHYGLGNLFFDQMDQYSVRELLDRHIFYDGKYISTQLLSALLEDYARPRPMTSEERKLLLDEVFEGSEW